MKSRNSSTCDAGRVAAFVFLSFLLAAPASASEAEKTGVPSAPDIVLILVDSLRNDHLGCYGYDRDTSPAMDALAGSASRFEQAIASGPWTQPSIMSIFTSVSPDIHLRGHWAKPHSTNVVTLAQALRDAGYQTIGITANPMTHRRFGFARGFDHYDDYTVALSPDSSEGQAASQAATGATMTRLAEDWLLRRRDKSKPLFLFVLYMDVHWDYLPPAPYNKMYTDDLIPPTRNIWSLGRKNVPEAARQRVIAAYDGEIRYTDVCVSNLLDKIAATPRADNTVVALCGDHGEAFWEHGLVSHGNNLYDEELRVPLIIRPPASSGPVPPGGRVVGTQVGTLDIGPTCLDLAGIAPPPAWQGRSLRPFMYGEKMAEVPVVLDNRVGKTPMRGVRTSQLKIVATPPFAGPSEIYDLTADPGETNNLFKSDAPLSDDVASLVPLLKPRE